MMQIINLGQAANDGTGEPLRQGGQKINANFTELDTRVTAAQTKADAAQPAVSGKGLSTNDFTTPEKTKLAGVATGATANSSDATLVNRANHTGTQLASTISNFAASVRDTVLTGIVFTQIAAVLATDSVLVAIGKLQAQITKGGWGIVGASIADINALDYSQKFSINTPATTANIPYKLGSTTVQFPAGSTGIMSNWSSGTTGHWQCLMFDRTSNNIAYRRMMSGVVQPDDYLVVYPTGKTYLDINQGGTGGATQGAAQTALGLVPVANTGDVTAGRLATVGWMGLGSVATPYWPDLNSISGTRTFAYGLGQTANMIPGMDYGEGIFLNGPSNTDGIMLLINHDSDRMFIKRKRGGNYSSGNEVYTNGNAVGDPASGGLMQSGSNANGFFSKFADGTLICWQHRTSSQVTTSTVVGSGFQSSGSVGYTFPIAFAAGYDVQVAPVATYVSGGSQPWGVATGKTLTGVSILAMAFHNNVVATCGYIATGRWK